MGLAPLGFDAYRAAFVAERERCGGEQRDRSDNEPRHRREAERTGAADPGNKCHQKQESEEWHEDQRDVS